MKGYPIKFWLWRWLVCLPFHRRHRRLTDFSYYRATGLRWYCNRCYEFRYLFLNPK